MNSTWLAIFKYGIIAVLGLAGVVLILLQKPRRHDVLHLIGVALLASAFFSIADVARDFLAAQQEIMAMSPPLRAQPELRDPEFWLEVFNKLPPTFVKKIEPGSQLTHLIDNPALSQFQGPPPTDVEVGSLTSAIKKDHAVGDEDAATHGYSIQLEFAEPGSGYTPQPILTVKRRFQHRGAYYIVGTYVPVKVEQVPNTPTINVQAVNGQVLFRLEKSDLGGLQVAVAGTVRQQSILGASQH